MNEEPREGRHQTFPKIGECLDIDIDGKIVAAQPASDVLRQQDTGLFRGSSAQFDHGNGSAKLKNAAGILSQQLGLDPPQVVFRSGALLLEERGPGFVINVERRNTLWRPSQIA